MDVFIIGLSYKTAPVHVREKLCFAGKEEWKEALAQIHSLPGIAECILLPTCNRTEVYFYLDEGRFSPGRRTFNPDVVGRKLCEVTGQNFDNLKKYFYTLSGQDALSHIFRVASGMDSMILGEDQILTQVKDAFQLALEIKTTSAILNTLMRKAITSSKKIKTFAQNNSDWHYAASRSIACSAIRLLEDVFTGDMGQKRALVIGSGKTGFLVMDELQKAGVKSIILAGRKYKSIKIPAYADLIDYQDRYSLINTCDIIVSATRSPHYTITREALEKSMGIPSRPKVFVDLAVPRDIDPEIAKMFHVAYFNIDSFQSSGQLPHIMLNSPDVQGIINKNIGDVKRWYEWKRAVS